MAFFIIDGGYFVKRFQTHWKEGKGKNLQWWQTQFELGNCTEQERDDNFHRIISNDLSYLIYRMEQVADIDYVFVCYDGVFGRRPRGHLFKGYKKNRSGVNPKKHQGRDIRARLEKCGIDAMSPLSGWEGVYNPYKEADDIIAEMAQLFVMCNKEVVIMSSDSDMYQLLALSSKIKLHNFTHEIDSDYVLEKCGVPPSQYVDWKSLVGDNSDGIPGIKGIGKATAVKLLKKHKRLEAIPFDSSQDFESAMLWKKLIGLPIHLY